VSDLEGRIALVTGAGSGIGAATARELARRGAKVYLTARSAEGIGRLAAEIKSEGGQGLARTCDVSDAGQVEALFAAIDEAYGALDVLVNNAAVLTAGPLHELSLDAWRRMLDVNVTGTFLCTQAALTRMRPRRSGTIVNVASVSGVPGVEKLPGLVAYAATKGAVLAFSEALAAEQAEAGIRVVAVSPGAVDTPMLRSVAPDFAPQAMSPDALARVIGFLASDAAAAVTNTNLIVWGPPGRRRTSQ